MDGHTRAAGLAAGNGDDMVWNLQRKQLVNRQTAKGMTTGEAFGDGSELGNTPLLRHQMSDVRYELLVSPEFGNVSGTRTRTQWFTPRFCQQDVNKLGAISNGTIPEGDVQNVLAVFEQGSISMLFQHLETNKRRERRANSGTRQPDDGRPMTTDAV
ncbi:hypothetical protein BDP55DRAFT_727805 [Colletotrichum godetiae]|uniref:Uncharacterized protein n=1 Tax=Colletotrichum godetiae TaxID=1209918 RepID=A0AAJ0ARI3_9PEZI|nr:uncharacterized protein BDP55DRAFT_727805 [Colletotrichum godetiae]KAK1676471.1 hypothetical protein BDP55DRAFT_727805 [Colletotrichum godetiae]